MNINKIQATLKHGRCLSSVYFIALALDCFYIAAIIMVFVVFAVTKDSGVLYANILLAIALSLFGYAFVVEHKKRKEVKEWLEDAVSLEAYITEADHYRFQCKRWSRICVMFTYDGKKYKKYGGDGAYFGQSFGFTNGYTPQSGLKAGYSPDFYKVLGERTIYYSPKYDQVMILKRDKR